MSGIGSKSTLYVFGIGAALVLMAVPPVAQQPYSQSGLLSCAMAPTIGLIVGSQQVMRCEFRPDRGTPEYYSGVMGRIGLDLGFTAGGQMAWAVLVNTQVPMRWALTGTYVGGSGDIALGIGVGANVLVGGNNSSVVLQPLSVEGQVGLNLALGIASLQLRPAR
jgi:hypothetical protein